MSILQTDDFRYGLVIMASGIGKRFGKNKLIEKLDDKPIIQWIIDATDNAFDKRVVVTRSCDVKSLCDSQNIQCILHEFPEKNDTVRLGMSALMKDVDYCFFAVGDQPLISKESIIRLISAANDNRNKIIRAGHGSTVGSPVGFPKQFFEELLNLPDKEGGNWVVKNNKDCVCVVELENEYELFDIDTISDLEIVKNVLKIR